MASRPKFNAALLLNPKTTTKQAGKDKAPANPYATTEPTFDPKDGYTNGHGGMASFIERHHGVENRSERPAKRVKRDNKPAEGEEEDDDDRLVQFKKKSEGRNIAASGEMGQYMKQQAEKRNGEVNEPPTVDLTEDQSDVESASTNDQRNVVSETTEVCLGRIDGARVNCFKVPTPKSKTAMISNQSHWMAMSVSLYRRPGPHSVIGVADPTGADCGQLDARVAPALCSLLAGASTTRLRLQARLDSRKKQPFEYPGQLISASYGITINVYAQRKYVTGIGKYLSQRQVWLQDPMVSDRGIQVVNPHAPKSHEPTKKVGASSSTRGGAQPSARTVEEVKRDVFKVFDALRETDNLPEMEAPSSVMTKLLAHQKQAVYFLNKREGLPVYTNTDGPMTIDDDDDHEDTKAADSGQADTLWQKKMTRTGRAVWINAITGHKMNEQPRPLLGGLLADVMGLGKTLNILSLLVGSLTKASDFGREPVEENDDGIIHRSKATLLICPLSTLVNWQDQIKAHLKKGTIECVQYQGPGRTNDAAELAKADIVLTTYQTVGNELARNSRNRPNKPLFEIDWFRVVLDEAHQIRNTNSLQSKAACQIKAERRWCLTGTPVQNRLEDLGALIKFLKISPFDEPGTFNQFISLPLRSGDPDAFPKLRILVDGITLRRLKDKLNLPKREEQIVHLEMSEAERSLYDQFSQDTNMKVNAMASDKGKLGGRGYAQVLKAIGRLRMICAHKEDMLSDEDWKMAKGFDATNAIDLEDEDERRAAKGSGELFEMYRLMREAAVAFCARCANTIEPPVTDDLEEDEDAIFGYMTPCNQLLCAGDCKNWWAEEMKNGATSDNRNSCPKCDAYVRIVCDPLSAKEFAKSEARQSIITTSKFARNLQRYSEPHTKTLELLKELAHSQKWTDRHPDQAPLKSVVFSEWTTHLDLIQLAFTNNKVPYTRLDGSMSFSKRTEALTTFATSPTVNVILVSLKAGGLGLNLTAASRVYVMEPNYNPAAEQQAIERVHRLGQTRDVKIKRYVMAGSIEVKIVELQRKKVELASFSINSVKGGIGEGRQNKIRQTLEDLRSLLR